MLKLKLKIKGKEHTFVQDELSTMAFRKVLEMQDKMERVEKGEIHLSYLEQVDLIINVIVAMFDDKKITFETVADGIPFNKLQEVMEELFSQMDALGGTISKEK